MVNIHAKYTRGCTTVTGRELPIYVTVEISGPSTYYGVTKVNIKSKQ